MFEFFYCKEFNESILNDSGKDVTLKRIDELRNRKDLLNTKKFAQYTKDLWILKITGGQHNIRIIFQKQAFLDNIDFYFAREYVSTSRYEPYWRKQIESNIEKWLENNPLDSSEIKKAHAEYYEKINKPKPELPTLPDEYKAWLKNYRLKIKFNIFETENWVKTSPHIKSINLGYINKLIEKILKADYEDVEIIDLDFSSNRNFKKAVNKEANVCILYDEAEVEENNKVILLHGGGHIQSQSSDIQQAEQYARELIGLRHVQNKQYTLIDISNCANKAYPISALTNTDTWQIIQDNKETSNLSLSPEQVNLLKDFVFPKFINGQAGSGKSTMLYYLFTDICHRKLMGSKGFDNDSFKGHPLFLTENHELLTNTRLAVKELLRCNSEYSELVKEFSLDVNSIDDYFFTFQNFLHKKLLSTDDYDQYNPQKLIKYSIFKEKYRESSIPVSIKKKYSSEVAWYIITTFIKGYDSKANVDINYFNTNIPKKDKSQIDNESFADVYTHIWIPFYLKLRDEGYWDKLDIVRYILNTYETLPEKYTVIFCDEAQDFTKIELELIIKLCVFTSYSLSTEKQVPITFAGDPFQTVNPTGFNLEKVKRLFHTELKKELNYGGDEIALVTDLKFNYRSSKPIVNLANFIQYIRYRYLNIKDISEPQEAKQTSEINSPLIFSLEDKNLNTEQLREKLKYDIIITPCDEGEEDEFAKLDKWLGNNAHIKSAIGAKGSEYSQVVIYKFGEVFLEHFKKESFTSFITGDYEKLSDSFKFKISFFFNKLYVAITRAQKKLIIIDTERGVCDFWDILKGNINITESIRQENSKWSDIVLLDLFEYGNESDIIQSDKKTAILNAERDKNKGIQLRDSDLMKSAAKYYDHVGEELDREFCLAKSMEYRGDYKRAGQKFEILRKIADASNCYWLGKEWKKIIDLLQTTESKEAKIRIFIANLMLYEKMDIQTFCELSDIMYNSLGSDQIADEIGWKIEFYNKLADILEVYLDECDETKSLKVANALEKLKTDNYEITYKITTKYFYKAKKYLSAIDNWNKTDKPYHDEYYRAQIEVTEDINKKIIYLNELTRPDYDRILELYENGKDKVNESSAKEIISTALIKKNRFYDALKIDINNLEKILKHINANIEHKMQQHLSLLYDLIEFINHNELNVVKKLVKINLLESSLNILNENKYLKYFLKKPLNMKELTSSSDLTFSQELQQDKYAIDIIKNIIKLISYSDIDTEDKLNDERFYPVLNGLEKLILFYAIKVKVLNWNSNDKDDAELICSLERISSDPKKICLVFEKLLSLNAKVKNIKVVNFINERWHKVKLKDIKRNLRGDIGQLGEHNMSIIIDNLKNEYGNFIKDISNEPTLQHLTIPVIDELSKFSNAIETISVAKFEDKKNETKENDKIGQISADIIDIVKRMQLKGHDKNHIMDITQLSIQQIEKIFESTEKLN